VFKSILNLLIFKETRQKIIINWICFLSRKKYEDMSSPASNCINQKVNIDWVEKIYVYWMVRISKWGLQLFGSEYFAQTINFQSFKFLIFKTDFSNYFYEVTAASKLIKTENIDFGVIQFHMIKISLWRFFQIKFRFYLRK